MDDINKWLERVSYGQYIIKDEFLISQVGRRADFLMISPSGRLINVEAKCNDFSTMLRQLDDHAQYCNYCFAYIPDYSLTPEWFKKTLAKKGYGLIVYNHKKGVVTEVFEAHQNKNIDNQLRNDVINLVRKAIKAQQLQLEIEKINMSQQQFNFQR